MKSISMLPAILFILGITQFEVKAQEVNQSTFEDYLAKIHHAYENGSPEEIWDFYTDESFEIMPEGSLVLGKSALKESWEQFMGMVDSKPVFTYQLTSWRLITPEVALVTWKSNADIKIQGQQVGGPTTCVALLHKKEGNWYVEFDGMTPILPAPAGN